jgi:hypothetical protein
MSGKKNIIIGLVREMLDFNLKERIGVVCLQIDIAEEVLSYHND